MSTNPSGRTRSQENNGLLSILDSWNMSTKFLLIIVVATLLPLIATAVFNLVSTRSQVIGEARNTVSQQAEAISPGLAQFLARETAVIDALAQDDTLRFILQEHHENMDTLSAAERNRLYSELDTIWRNGDENTPLIAAVLPSEPESHDHDAPAGVNDEAHDDDHDEAHDDDHEEAHDDDHDEAHDDDHEEAHDEDHEEAHDDDHEEFIEGSRGELTDQFLGGLDSDFGTIAHQFLHFIDGVNVELFVTDAAGGTIATTGLLSDFYQADEDWWQLAYANGEGNYYISEPEFDESSDTSAVLIAIPIWDENESEILGIIRGTISFQSIQSLVENTTVGTTGFVELYTVGGTLISGGDAHEHEHEEEAGSEDAALTAFLPNVNATATDTTNEILSHDGAESIVALHNMDIPAFGDNNVDKVVDAVNNLDWVVVAIQPLSEVTSSLNQQNLISTLLSIAAAIIGVVAGRFLIGRSLKQLNALRPAFASIQKGDYSARAQVITKDELGEIAVSFNTMLDETTSLIQSQDERDTLQQSIITLLDEVSAVAEGDLTTEAEVRADITGAIADSFNFMIEQLRDIIQNVQSATLEVTTSANQIQSTAEMLATGSKTQAGQIVDTSAAIDEMSVSIQQVSDNAARSATVGEQARENAQLGSEAVKATIGGMDRIRDEVAQTAERLGRLEASSREIGKVTKVINDIAARTSILAINASIQASEAGDAGRGFAVVAQEVELLADRSSAASQQINRLVNIIQVETGEVSSAMTSTSREVSRGAHLATEAGQRLDEIEMVSTQLSSLIQSISQASQQQARGSEAIAQSMQEIAVVTNRTATGTNEATTSIGKLAILANELRESVSQFKIKA